MKRFFLGIILLFTLHVVRAQSAAWQSNAQVKQLMQQGAKFEEGGDHVKAVNSYLAAFNLDQTNYMAANAMAGVMAGMKDYKPAIIWAQKAVALKPVYAPAYVVLGNAYTGQKDYALAPQNYNTAIKLAPTDPYPVYALGLVAEATGDTRKAVLLYEKSQKVDSNFTDAWYTMAVAYDKLKDYTKAYKYADNYRMIDLGDNALRLWRHITKDIAAQPFQYPAIPANGKKPEDFVATGWKIKGKAIGDLNGDGQPDAALVLEYNTIAAEVRDKGDTIYSQPRILLVLLKNGGHFEKAVQQNTFMLRAEEGDHMSGDPYDNIAISKGILSINYEYTRSHLYYKFRYQANDFYLIGATNAGAENNTLFSYDFNFSTKEYDGHWGEPIDGNKTLKGKKAHKIMQITRPKKLSELTVPYGWEVMKGVFI